MSEIDKFTLGFLSGKSSILSKCIHNATDVVKSELHVYALYISAPLIWLLEMAETCWSSLLCVWVGEVSCTVSW
jgi:hypothetical protein